MKSISVLKSFCTVVILSVFTMLSFVIDVRTNEGEMGITKYTVSIVSETYAICPGGAGCPTAGPATNQANNQSESAWLKNAVDALNAILGFFTFLITPLIALAGWLLSPDWTRGDLFGLNQGLYRIWITISNITYFLYALGLIGIALATIFSVENYTYKQLLPKLALGILIVPFTWWIVQAVLSVSSILAVAVMQIPRDTLEIISGPSTAGTWYTQKSIPKIISYNSKVTNGIDTSAGTQGCIKDGKEVAENNTNCISPKDILTDSSSGPYSMLTIYAYNVFKIQEYKSIDNVKEGITVLMQVFNKLIFGALIYLIFGLLILALVFALLARAFELWIITMFSPLLSLSVVLPDSMKGESFKEHISFQNLISLAMIPVYVAGALSFGILFLGVLMNGQTVGSGNTTNTNCGGETNSMCLFGSTDSFLQVAGYANGGPDETSLIRSTFKLGGFTLNHFGTVTNEQANAIEGTTNFFNGSGGIIGTVILNIIGLVLLWLALMGALKASKITASAIEPFEKAGKTIGEFGKSLPKYTPIPGTGGLSAKSLERLSSLPKNIADTKQSGRDQKVEDRIKASFGIGNSFGAIEEQKLREIASKKITSTPEVDYARQHGNNVVSKGIDIKSGEGQKFLGAMSDVIKSTSEDMRKRSGINFDNDQIDKLSPGERAKLVAQFLHGSSDGKYIRESEAEAIQFFKDKKGAGTSSSGPSVGTISRVTENDNGTKTINITTTIGESKIQLSADGKIINRNTELQDFKDLYKERTKDSNELIENIKKDFKDKLKQEDIDWLIDEMKKQPDSFYRKPSDSSKKTEEPKK